MNFNYKNPISPISFLGNSSVPRDQTYGTNYSVLSTGGYMEVYSLSDLNYQIPSGNTGLIEYSANTIPIQFNKGLGTIFSPDVLTLHSDNISSGRRKLGMLVYVYETDKIYQHTIDNYDLLWTAATNASGPGGQTVVISEFGTTIKNNSVAGQNFINVWTASTIEGVSGYTNLNATWRVLQTGGGGTFTGGTVTGDTIFTSGLTANTFSASTYLGLPADIFITGGTFDTSTDTLTLERSSGSTITITGFTDYYTTAFTYSSNTLTIYDNSGNTFPVTINDFTGLTINGSLSATTISATTYQNLPIDPDTYVTGFTYSSNTFTISDNSGNTFDATFNEVTGLTINGGLSATTISATTYYNFPEFTGNTSANCISDVYVSNIHSCSPLNINPLNEGNVYFGSTSAVTIDLSNNNVGIGIPTPSAKLHINNVTTGYTFLAEDSTNPDSTPFTIDAAGNTFIGGLASNWDGFSKVDVDGSYLKIRQTSNALSVGDSGAYTGDWQYGAVGGRLQFVKSGIGTAFYLYSFGNSDNVTFGTYVPATNVFRVGGNTAWWLTQDQYTKVAIKSDNTGSSSYSLKVFNSSDQPMFVIKDNANVGVNILNPSEELEVSGRTKTTNFTMTSGATNGYVLTSDGSGNASWSPVSGASGYSDVYVTGFTYSANTFTISDNSGNTFDAIINDVTGLTVNGDLSVTGNTILNSFSGTSGYISGSGQNILTVVGSGNTLSPLFSVQGSVGQLFEVYDSLTGVLFSVNGLSSQPILQVNSDDTILMGSYLSPSLNTTIKSSLVSGTNTIYSIPTSAYTGAFFDYTLISTGTTGARAGTIMSIWSGATAQYTETSTNDIGTTTGVTFSVGVSGANAVLSSSATTSEWILKTIVRSI